MNAALPSAAVRRDIEGLRALAVLAVVAGHVAPSLLQGGFCGVDVFFVISGYLIGRHLLEDIEAGRFSFLHFYARRARRILPALVTVLIGVWGVGWLILSGPELSALGRHIAAAAVFSNNILLWSETGYFDTAATSKPLLHLWSLGIEEQFYLLVPLLLWLGARGRDASVRWVGRASLVSLLILLIEPMPSFFLLHTRFWELGAGVATGYLSLKAAALGRGTLAVSKARYRELLLWALALMFVVALRLGAREDDAGQASLAASLALGGLFILGICTAQLASAYQRPAAWQKLAALCQRHVLRLRAAAASAGLALIAGSMLAMTPADWPGAQTLFPVLGTALVIAAGPGTAVNRLLAAAPLVFVGSISYPLYLWHWPALVFSRFLGGAGLATSLIPVCAAFLLAWATREWVEDPIRFGRLAGRAVAAPPVWAVSLALVLTGLVGVSAVATEGYPGRFSPALRAIASWSVPDPYSPWRANRCYQQPGVTAPYAPECTPERRPGIPQVLLWGDSHAADLYPGLLELQTRDGFGVVQWTAAGCPPTRTALVREQPACSERRAAALAAMTRLAPDTVLLAGAWELYLDWGASEDRIVAATQDVIGWLRQSGVRQIVLFGPAPTWNATLPTDLFRYMSLRRTEHVPLRLGSVTDEVRRLDGALAAQAVAAHVRYVSVLDRFCDSRGCRTQGREGQVPPDLLFRDRDHLTVSGSRFLLDAAACQIFVDPSCPASP
ncbi:MAG TPA: acyltransferase family protein [Steroidobacteraceae bacterium]|nr:acyltransferase family protein [Steroidobacteraceae bacterium]